MGHFKEEAHTFKTLQKIQSQIYNDAADYGYSYNTNKLPLIVTNVLKSIETFRKLDEEFPNEVPLMSKRITYKNGVAIVIRIVWEKDNGMENGTYYDISYNKTGNHFSRLNKDHNAFISIDIRNFSEIPK